MSQYVGKTISLVDTHQVRYVGVLAEVSAETSTLVIRDVLNYGTEQRVSGAQAVSASSSKIAEMRFKGSELSDLQVLEGSSATTAEQATQSTDRNADVDFIAQTIQFSKDENSAVKADPVYNKSNSFFDNLAGPDRTNRDAFVRHDLMNVDTFGEDSRSTSVARRGRGGRGGRGRGGRGRGGHGGRGGRHEGRGGFGGSSFDADQPRDSHQWQEPRESRNLTDADGFVTAQRRRAPNNERNDINRYENHGEGRGGRGGRRGRGGRGNHGRGGQAGPTEFVPGSDGGQFL